MTTLPRNPHAPGLRLVGTGEPVRLSPAVLMHARVVAGRTGGPDKTIFETCARVDPNRYAIHLVYIHPAADPIARELEERAARIPCPLHRIAESGAWDIRTLLALIRLCKQLKVDLWHAHDYKTNALGLILRRFHPMKLVTTVHGWTDETRRTRFYHQLDNWMLAHYDQIMAVSRRLHEQCLALGVPADRLSHVPNGIAWENYPPTERQESMRKFLGIPPQGQVIGLVGRLSPEKGIDRALQTIARLIAMRHDVYLLLVGDGPQRNDLLRLCEQLRITERVLFAGWQQDPRPYYQAMNLLLLSSLTEGMPNVVLEAMASGIPVAATDVGDVRLLLEDGRCGLILSPQAEDWALPLGYWLPQTRELQALARRARHRLLTHFSFDQRVDRELAIYDRVLSRVRPATAERQAA